MRAKDIRNLIISLIIVAVGIKLITAISRDYMSSVGSVGSFSELIGSFNSLGDFALYGLVLLAILLVPFYLSKRSKEKI